jgi:hypothetical protein
MDINTSAFRIVQRATSDDPSDPARERKRRAGVKGGTARANALTSEARKGIARKANEARWHKQSV